MKKMLSLVAFALLFASLAGCIVYERGSGPYYRRYPDRYPDRYYRYGSRFD